jgi:hypothetical protein
MDILAHLNDRLDFIMRFYDQAAVPSETIKRKIEAHEDPYVPQCAPGDHDGPEYLSEWVETDNCLQTLGQCSLSLVEKALHDYLVEFIARERGDPDLYKKGGGGWLGCFERFLEDRTQFRWSASPVDRSQIEQINLSRNDFTHDPDLQGIRPRQTDYHFKKHPITRFADDLDLATMTAEDGTPEVPLSLNVTREKLILAVDDVRKFCTFVEARRTPSSY